ncbi:MAG: M20 family metallopeptidase [Actinomycetota bacterium]|nr:M20 family metallopeptidase [Actinomycetota bacterium]
MWQVSVLLSADFATSLDRDRLVDRLGQLVRTPSENPPGEEAAVASLTSALCRDLGLEVEEHEVEPGRPSVVARWRGSPGPTLCYCSHIDVVPAGDPGLWSRDPYSAAVEDGRMFGRGSSDAKGPCAAALEAVALLKASGWEPSGTLELALVADEETMGFKGAGYLVERNVLDPDVAIVGEPTSLRVVRAQRGAGWFRVTTMGLAGHGSAPERGINAIKHMAEIVLHLEDTLPDVTHPLLGGPTINVGTIRGGEKVNIIPAGCMIEVDRRTVPGETKESVVAGIQEAIERARERFPDVEARIELAFFAEPFEVAADAPVVAAAVDATRAVTGAEPDVIGFRGASDARFLFETGCDVVVWGPGDIALAHTARESIDLAELERGALAYAGAFATLLGGDA